MADRNSDSESSTEGGDQAVTDPDTGGRGGNTRHDATARARGASGCV